MNLERATNAEIAALPTIVYSPSTVSVRVDGQGGTAYLAVMFKHPPRVEVFRIVSNDGPFDASAIDAAVAKMVIEEPDAS